MEFERLTYLLKQKENDIEKMELKKKSEKEKQIRKKSMRKIKILVNLYGSIDLKEK